MDVLGWATGFWRTFQAALPDSWSDVPAFLMDLVATSPVRWAGLMLVVYATIRIIAGVYSGDKQNAELGPVAIRPHVARRFGDDTIRIPAELMPMNMDGVAATCELFYVYADQRGKRRKVLLHTIKDSRLSVSPVRMPRIQNMRFGYEIPDVPTEWVCFPPADVDENQQTLPATPAAARDYAALYKIIDNWKEDDEAPVVSTSQEVMETIDNEKTIFIKRSVERLKRLKTGFFSQRLSFTRAYNERPNVVGSYYVKFEFSHDPFFVLTRHPDKDLKMTAWLTVLTSLFALLMEAWPHDRANPFRAQFSAHAEGAAPSVTKVTPTVR